MDLEGIYPPMITPTTGPTGDVDVDALRDYTDFLVDGGVHGLFPCGSTGEFASLTHEERARVIETVADQSGDATVLAGCGGTSVSHVLDRIEDASAAGADAAVVVAPYYLTTTQKGLQRYYEVIADDAVLPIVLYNIPMLTNNPLEVETVAALAEHDGIVGIKDTTFSLGYHSKLLAAAPEDFSVLNGTSILMLSSLQMGAVGGTPGAANVFPDEVVEIYDAQRAGDYDRANRLMDDVVRPLSDVVSDLPTAPAFKHFLKCAGHDVGQALLPLPELSDEEKATVEDCYERIASRVE